MGHAVEYEMRYKRQYRSENWILDDDGDGDACEDMIKTGHLCSLACIVVRMTGRTHDLAALTALAGVLLLEPVGQMSLATLLLGLLMNQIGGITPDIDQPTAPFWRNLPIGGVFGRIVDKLLGGHRFLSHSLLGVGIFGFGSYWLLRFFSPLMPGVNLDYVWFAFLVGFISHLVMDTFTKEGVPWLLPVPIKFGLPPLKRIRITTGKRMETFVISPLLLLLLAWIMLTHYQQIESFLRHSVTN